MELSRKKKILVSPLDWGLGHATRCIPLISMLVDKGFEVLIGADGRPAALLRKEFPELEQVRIPGYDIHYPKGSGMAISMALQLPQIYSAVNREHQLTENLVLKEGIDAVISDNRFGCWSARVPSVYITHQLSIKAPAGLSFAEPLLYCLHVGFMRHYGECWIPDIAGQGSLSGDLAHRRRSPVPAYFVGPLTRFKNSAPAKGKIYDLMFIISGPEPQRGIFENLIMDALSKGNYKALVVAGRPETIENKITGPGVKLCTHMETPAMMEAMMASELIICRSGYSGIMDLATLGCRAAFVPTPGQTEQEYLARYHHLKGNYFQVSQKKFNLDGLVKNAMEFGGVKITPDHSLLSARINELAARLESKR